MFTFGMPTFDDYDGPVFTAVDLLAHHGDLIDEIVILDNNPGGPVSGALKEFCVHNCRLKYVAFGEPRGTAPAKNAVFDHATGEFVVCVDSHVVLLPGAVAALAEFLDANPAAADDLVHGPLVYDCLDRVETHFSDEWSGKMWGRWAYDPRVLTEPWFPIPAMGMGLFCARRETWLRFPARYRGFGAEEWVIHEKYRNHGRRVWCVSGLRWWHRFGRPTGTRYPNTDRERARNYIIGMTEERIPLDRGRAEFVGSGFPAEEWDKLVANPDAGCGCGEQPAAGPKPLATQADLGTTVKLPRTPRRATWAERYDGLGGDPTAFRLRTTPEILGWLAEHAPKAKRFLAVHNIDTHGEYADPKRRPDAANPDANLLGLMPGVRRFLADHPEWSVVDHVEGDGGLLVLSKDDRDRPAIEPGPAEQALRYTRSKFSHWWAGGHFLPLPMAERRLDQCLVCPAMAKDRRCSKCSCYLVERPDGSPGKVFYPRDSCPLGKWLAADVPKGGFKVEDLKPPPAALPLVSCLMPTYGRAPEQLHLLAEAVYWFTRQDYPPDRCELVILNDAPGQVLTCSAPGVRIVNLGERVPTLGEKRNRLIDLAAGEVLLPWDDDDVSLPGRISQAVMLLGGADYWEPAGRWVEMHGHLKPDWDNCVHHASAFRKASGLRYPHTSKGEDTQFVEGAYAAGKAIRCRGDRRDHLGLTPFTYVYRWGVSSAHISAQSDPAAWYAARPAPPAGTWEIVPAATKDYAALTEGLRTAAAVA